MLEKKEPHIKEPTHKISFNHLVEIGILEWILVFSSCMSITCYPSIQFNVETVNFMCQFDQATGCPDIWLNILGGSMRMFLDEINTEIGRLSKADCPPQCGCASSNPLEAGIEQKTE